MEQEATGKNTIQLVIKENDPCLGWISDWKSNFMSSRDDDIDKIKCNLEHGKRVFWYFKDDKEYCDEFELDVNSEHIFSGLVVAAPDVSNPEHRELEAEEVLIIQDRYPVEKCDCEATYFMLNRLLENEELVEIYE